MTKKKHIEPIPEEFASYEEAAEFWDTHDTTDYPDAFRTIEVETEFRGRWRYCDIGIAEDVAIVLQKRAQQLGVSVGALASHILRQELSAVSS